MTDWIITVPQGTDWREYQKEINAVKDGREYMNYRLPYKPKAQKGDRCFILYRGIVRGWMEIVDVVYRPMGFTCTTTGVQWPEGWYLRRSGEFHEVEGHARMIGFRGVRRYEPKTSQ